MSVDLVKIPTNALDSALDARQAKTANGKIIGLNDLVIDAAGNEFVVTRIDPRTSRLVLVSTAGEWEGPRLVARSPRTVKAVVRFGKIAKASAKAQERIAARTAYRKARADFAAAQG